MKKNILSNKLKVTSLVFALLLISCMNILSAYSIYEVYNHNQGTFINHHDARTAALGGSGVAGGFTAMDSNLNPANLNFLEEKTGMQFNYSLIKNSENRALPMYNFFDSYVDESTYARNENFYNEISFFAFTSLDLITSKISLGFSYRPLINFHADYQEQVRNDENSDADNYPPIIAKNFIESEGFLDSYNLILNWGNKTVSIGTEVSLLKGKYDIERRIHWSDYAHEKVGAGVLNDELNMISNRIDGYGTKYGVSFQSPLNRRLRIGMTYSPKISLNTDFKENDILVNNSDDFIIPSKLRFGFLFQPRNPFKTNFQLDMEYIKNSEINKFYDNSWSFFVGMEHYVGRAIPFRLGFRHETSLQDKTIALPVVSAGSGFPLTEKIHLDFSGEYGRREYKALDLFMDSFYNQPSLWRSIEPKDRGWDNPDIVTESFFKVFTSLSVKW